MLLLRNFGIVSVHFAGLPPGTAALMIKFVPPEVVERFGGPDTIAEAIENSLSELGDVIAKNALHKLLMDAD
jgi:L-seryl-tRNA(Ser) seleniumtransferase